MSPLAVAIWKHRKQITPPIPMSTTTNFQPSRFVPTRQAFSLTELLTCVAILGILAAASAPAFTSLVRGNDVSSSLQTLGGVLESARQYAITKNTHVWVAFSDVDPADEQPKVSIAVVSSRTGDDILPWTTDVIDLSTYSNLELVDKVQALPGVKLMDPDLITVHCTKNTNATAVRNLEHVAWDIVVAGKSRRFTYALQFAPSGETRVGELSHSVELGLTQALGESRNAAIVRVTGITGRVIVLR